MRKVRITDRNWRPEGFLFHPGVYRVPLDMSEAMADRAVAEGFAEEMQKPAVLETKPAPVISKRPAK
jgi:hypothetical protein